jgi:hypothetical protein
MAMKARPISRWQELHSAVSPLNAIANFALSFASIASLHTKTRPAPRLKEFLADPEPLTRGSYPQNAKFPI